MTLSIIQVTSEKSKLIPGSGTIHEGYSNRGVFYCDGCRRTVDPTFVFYDGESVVACTDCFLKGIILENRDFSGVIEEPEEAAKSDERISDIVSEAIGEHDDETCVSHISAE